MQLSIPFFKSEELELITPSMRTAQEIPLISEPLSAGFPSPALDFEGETLDLNKELISNASSTYYGRIKGDSMQNAGIDHGDLIVIDKSITSKNNRIAVCFIDGEFTVKRVRIEQNCCWLIPANDKYEPIQVMEGSNFHIWGVVTHVIKSF